MVAISMTVALEFNKCWETIIIITARILNPTVQYLWETICENCPSSIVDLQRHRHSDPVAHRESSENMRTSLNWHDV